MVIVRSGGMTGSARFAAAAVFCAATLLLAGASPLPPREAPGEGELNSPLPTREGQGEGNLATSGAPQDQPPSHVPTFPPSHATGEASTPAPILTLTADDTVVTTSCRIQIPPDTVIHDANGDGVLLVRGSDLELTFTPGSVLAGASGDARPDTYEGVGIRVLDGGNITITGGRIRGFRAAIWATRADGLLLQGLDASDNRRAHLASTPLAEAGGDWLWPHDNEENEWLSRYGAALYVEESTGVTIRRCRVRHGQNALCLDRVTHGRIYDNDFSFNSGWGIALWRSSHNVITRNALDFCIRGYSHGVYNRGQDSAGILAFEQNNENVIAENSATHGGDGFFGFAGREALGQRPAPRPDFGYHRRGNNRNLLVRNDFSYAAAHGIEMTFSFDNRFLANRLVGNAICGVWGGFSQDTLIARNEIAANGDTGYGLERGGVNIDSGRGNRIVHNTFRDNACGIHLWWRDGRYDDTPWANVNLRDWEGNLIARNAFTGDKLALHLRGAGKVTLADNTYENVHEEARIDDEMTVVRDEPVDVPLPELPEYPVYGETRPVGARPHLRGRAQIIMTEWGPWDHDSPLVRRVENDGHRHVLEMHKLPAVPVIELKGDGVHGHPLPTDEPRDIVRYEVRADHPGLHDYVVKITAGEFAAQHRDTLAVACWQVVVVSTTAEAPPEGADWDVLVEGARPSVELATLDLVRRPLESLPLPAGPPAADSGRDENGAPPRPSYALQAVAEIPVSPGRLHVRIVADDAVRLTADDVVLIERWRPSWRPREHQATVEVAAPGTLRLKVEHFRLHGPPAIAVDLRR